MTPDQIINRLRELIDDGSLPYDDMDYCLDCRMSRHTWKPGSVLEWVDTAHESTCVFLAIKPTLNDGRVPVPSAKAYDFNRVYA